MDRVWREASSVCAKQTELEDTKAQQQLANGGPMAEQGRHTALPQSKIAYLPRRWAPYEDKQDPQGPLPTQSRTPSAPIPTPQTG